MVVICQQLEALVGEVALFTLVATVVSVQEEWSTFMVVVVVAMIINKPALVEPDILVAAAEEVTPTSGDHPLMITKVHLEAVDLQQLVVMVEGPMARTDMS